MMRVIETIELQPDETMVTTEGRAGRVMALSPLQRLYRKGVISSEAYRVGQCLEADLQMLLGSSAWAAVSETLGSPVDTGRRTEGVSAASLGAAGRVRRAQAAVGFREQFLTLVGLLEGFGTEELDRLWQRRKGNARATCVESLTAVVEANVYETLKHQPSVWAEAAA
jgi:hypothetical protein